VGTVADITVALDDNNRGDRTAPADAATRQALADPRSLATREDLARWFEQWAAWRVREGQLEDDPHGVESEYVHMIGEGRYPGFSEVERQQVRLALRGASSAGASAAGTSAAASSSSSQPPYEPAGDPPTDAERGRGASPDADVVVDVAPDADAESDEATEIAVVLWGNSLLRDPDERRRRQGASHTAADQGREESAPSAAPAAAAAAAAAATHTMASRPHEPVLDVAEAIDEAALVTWMKDLLDSRAQERRVHRRAHPLLEALRRVSEGRISPAWSAVLDEQERLEAERASQATTQPSAVPASAPGPSSGPPPATHTYTKPGVRTSSSSSSSSASGGTAAAAAASSASARVEPPSGRPAAQINALTAQPMGAAGAAANMSSGERNEAAHVLGAPQVGSAVPGDHPVGPRQVFALTPPSGISHTTPLPDLRTLTMQPTGAAPSPRPPSPALFQPADLFDLSLPISKMAAMAMATDDAKRAALRSQLATRTRQQELLGHTAETITSTLLNSVQQHIDKAIRRLGLADVLAFDIEDDLEAGLKVVYVLERGSGEEWRAMGRFLRLAFIYRLTPADATRPLRVSADALPTAAAFQQLPLAMALYKIIGHLLTHRGTSLALQHGNDGIYWIKNEWFRVLPLGDLPGGHGYAEGYKRTDPVIRRFDSFLYPSFSAFLLDHRLGWYVVWWLP